MDEEEYVICPVCGYKNPTGAKFCAHCGAPLVSGIQKEKEEEYIICPKCGFKNPKGAKFCARCGAPLVEKKKEEKFIICPKCGFKNPPGAKFCASCGAPLVKEEKVEESKKDENLERILQEIEGLKKEIKGLKKMWLMEEMKRKEKEKKMMDTMLYLGMGAFCLGYVLGFIIAE
ncbi:hypothetical protein DRQ20_02230 [bacterium]|nr:MAG: hypothetical protein DRQ20_02230 [bacterium]